MHLSKMLSRVVDDFVYERAKPFKNSRFGAFVRKEIAEEAKKHTLFLPNDLKVKSSVGAGNWAAVPWLAFFDPLITETATRGFYVVYLINPQDNSIVLSLNQGTTAVYNEFGKNKGKEVLRRRAVDLADRVDDLIKDFSRDPIQLGSNEDLPAGYEAGHAFGVIYPRNGLTERNCLADLEQMLEAYGELVKRGGLLPTDLMVAEAGGGSIEETRKLVFSRRIERSPKVRRAVLAARKPVCEACGLDPAKDYEFNGKPIETPLDVHHVIPLFTLSEGETKRYSIPDDFLVLCPTCHRMIHKQTNRSDLEKLRKRIRFRYMRELLW